MPGKAMLTNTVSPLSRTTQPMHVTRRVVHSGGWVGTRWARERRSNRLGCRPAGQRVLWTDVAKVDEPPIAL